METLDTFARSFLPAVVRAGIPLATVRRHVGVLRRCAGDRDAVTLVAVCSRTDKPLHRHLLMLTRHRLVVTTENRLLHRIALHLNADLRHLADVIWTPEPGGHAVHLALTAVDGVREHLCIRLADANQVPHLDEAFRVAFRDPWRAATPAPAASDLRLAA